MKFTLMVLTTLISVSSYAACNREAQFIGTAKNIKHQAATKSSPEQFSFQIKRGHWFEPSIVCPMDEEELESATVVVEGAPGIQEGDAISGVLVYDQQTKSYRVE